MLPTSTVENYLKAIHAGQSRLAGDRATTDRDLVPMGQLSTALGVVPGTATAMVKTLAEAGLAFYEPYAGVRLTPAGEKLAAAVLRRHRLVELFLVQVMGMNWDEVHDEAELLEHAVSDRLIERIDAMLGHPAVDPHGDPIPDSDGVIHTPDLATLLTCATNQPLRVSRVVDQDATFLRFIEQSHLKPGQPVMVEERDTAADRVTVRANGASLALGQRAASKVLVEPDSSPGSAGLSAAGPQAGASSARPCEHAIERGDAMLARPEAVARHLPEAVVGETEARAAAAGGLGVHPRVTEEQRRFRHGTGAGHERDEPGRVRLAAVCGIAAQRLNEIPPEIEGVEETIGMVLRLVGQHRQREPLGQAARGRRRRRDRAAYDRRGAARRWR